MKNVSIVSVIALCLFFAGCATFKSNDVEDEDTPEIPVEQVVETYSLSVRTNVDGANIEIKNHEEAYHDEIQLINGEYIIEVYKEGYQIEQRRVIISDIDLIVNIELTSTIVIPSLTVRPDVEDAYIRIINIKPKYYDGIPLENGKYHVIVSKKGYVTQEEWVTIDGDVLVLEVTMEKLYETFKLFIKPDIKDAIVRILNIKDKYEDNMELPKGKYFIDVSKEGYNTFQKWVHIEDQDVIIPVTLTPEI